MGEFKMKKFAVKPTVLLIAAGIGFGAATSAWSAESLQDVMKRRNLSQQDLLAASKTYVPTGKRDEFVVSAPAASPARSSCTAFRPCAS
jgi:nitrous-oxide reductase